MQNPANRWSKPSTSKKFTENRMSTSNPKKKRRVIEEARDSVTVDLFGASKR